MGRTSLYISASERTWRSSALLLAMVWLPYAAWRRGLGRESGLAFCVPSRIIPSCRAHTSHRVPRCAYQVTPRRDRREPMSRGDEGTASWGLLANGRGLVTADACMAATPSWLDSGEAHDDNLHRRRRMARPDPKHRPQTPTATKMKLSLPVESSMAVGAPGIGARRILRRTAPRSQSHARLCLRRWSVRRP